MICGHVIHVRVWQTRVNSKLPFFETNSKKTLEDGWLEDDISFWGLVLLASGSCNPKVLNLFRLMNRYPSSETMCEFYLRSSREDIPKV